MLQHEEEELSVVRYINTLVVLAALALSVAVVQAQTVASDTGPALTGAGTFYGQLQSMGSGTAATWVTVDRYNRPQALGVTLSPGALMNLPDAMTEYVLTLPPQARRTPFTHFALDWNPHGHIPAHVYDVPHFDLHFYIISPELRSRITATGDDLAVVERVPEARFVPQGYVATPGGEPRMGAHWVNPASPEFTGQPFTHTFIYGFYNGRMAFLEPMVATAFLQTHPNIDVAIPQPTAYPMRGYYPTRYSIRYDPATQLTHFALTGFVERRQR